MFERFAPDAKATVVHARHHARRLGHNYIGGEHLLLAVASADHPASAILGAHGVTAAYVEQEILRRIGPGPGARSGDGLFGSLDRDALASIGIDLDTVRARIEASFGPHAMADADLMMRRKMKGRIASRRPRLDPRRALRRLARNRHTHRNRRLDAAMPPGPSRRAETAGRNRACGAPHDGHIPFTPVAKRILELTLRETLALHDSTIGVQHIALALTAVRRGIVPSLLAGADASASALHAEIADRYRQAS